VRRPEPAALVAGTVVEMRDLYYNTPARRKFLKSEGTEFAHCAEAVKRVALAHPEVAFTLCAQRPRQPASAAQRFARSRRRHPRRRFPRRIARSPRWRGWRATACASPATAHAGHSRARSDAQYCYVNGRFRARQAAQPRPARSLSGHAARQPLPGLLPVPHRSIRPNVDVNVHPAEDRSPLPRCARRASVRLSRCAIGRCPARWPRRRQRWPEPAIRTAAEQSAPFTGAARSARCARKREERPKRRGRNARVRCASANRPVRRLLRLRRAKRNRNAAGPLARCPRRRHARRRRTATSATRWPNCTASTSWRRTPRPGRRGHARRARTHPLREAEERARQQAHRHAGAAHSGRVHRRLRSTSPPPRSTPKRCSTSVSTSRRWADATRRARRSGAAAGRRPRQPGALAARRTARARRHAN
jgi:hypothetical protein